MLKKYQTVWNITHTGTAMTMYRFRSSNSHSCNVCQLHGTERLIPGPLFAKRPDVLPQDSVKSCSREIQVNTFPIALKFSRHLGFPDFTGFCGKMSVRLHISSLSQSPLARILYVTCNKFHICVTDVDKIWSSDISQDGIVMTIRLFYSPVIAIILANYTVHKMAPIRNISTIVWLLTHIVYVDYSLLIPKFHSFIFICVIFYIASFTVTHKSQSKCRLLSVVK